MIKRFFSKLAEQFSEIRFASASLAFSTLISIIPFLIIVLAVLQSIGGLEKIYPEIENWMFSYFKEATGSTVSLYIKKSLAQFQPQTLGVTGGVLLLLTSLSLIRDVDTAFHRIWKLKITTPIYSRIWLYWLLLLLIPINLALFTGLKSVNTINFMSQSFEQQFLFSIGTFVFLFTIYKIIPSCEVSALAATIPALAVAISLAMVQKSFLWFSLKVFKQNKIYGSLASFPIFLLWLLTVWFIILTGVALSSLIQNKLKKIN